jgi:hypothetical protein
MWSCGTKEVGNYSNVAKRFLYSIKNDVPGLSEYLQEMENLSKIKNFLFITTHDRVLLDNTFKNMSVLFDEDPTSNWRSTVHRYKSVDNSIP